MYLRLLALVDGWMDKVALGQDQKVGPHFSLNGRQASVRKGWDPLGLGLGVPQSPAERGLSRSGGWNEETDKE